LFFQENCCTIFLTVGPALGKPAHVSALYLIFKFSSRKPQETWQETSALLSVQTGQSDYQWWSIQEIYAMDSTGALINRSKWAGSASSAGYALTESMAFDGNQTSK
jgi:hypothetical protein